MEIIASPNWSVSSAGARSIIHVDMDAFFASVEVQNGSAPSGVPVIVIGRGSRGVVLSATYEARALGVRAAMPAGKARLICPDAHFLHPRFDLYRENSGKVMAILDRFSPLVEPASLDEAYVDVTGASRLFGEAPQIAQEIRRSIANELGLPSSAGVGPSKTIAKLASNLAKPNGLLVVRRGESHEFLHGLAVEQLPGIGSATVATLSAMGIREVRDIANVSVEFLTSHLGFVQGLRLHELATGQDDRPVEPARKPKSIGHERTFEEDLNGDEALRLELLRLSDELARRLRDSRLVAWTITLKVRLASLKMLTRSKTLRSATDVRRAIFVETCELLSSLRLGGERVRLLGIIATNLSGHDTTGGQLSLDLDSDMYGDEKQRAVELATDEVRRKFGENSIAIAALKRKRGG